MQSGPANGARRQRLPGLVGGENHRKTECDFRGRRIVSERGSRLGLPLFQETPMRFLLLIVAGALSVSIGLAETTTGVCSYYARSHNGHKRPAGKSSIATL